MDWKLRSLRVKSLLLRSGLALATLGLIAFLARTTLVAATETPARSEVESQVDAMLGTMSLQDKIDFIGGVDGFFIRSLPGSNLPRLKMADGPVGVRNFGPATAMAGGINLAATWDTALARRVGEQIGRDARAKGVNFLLGPGVNIYRAPMNGRNFEYFGEDPYLASRIAVGISRECKAKASAPRLSTSWATIQNTLGTWSTISSTNAQCVKSTFPSSKQQ